MNAKLVPAVLALAIGLFGAMANAGAENCRPAIENMLVVQKYHLALTKKEPICTKVPGQFTIVINNPPGSGVEVEAGHVSADSKSSSGPTITGSNSADKNYLVVTVSGAAALNQILHFNINVEGVGLLDPTVRVVPSFDYGIMQMQAVDEFLYVLGLSVDEYLKLKSEVQAE